MYQRVFTREEGTVILMLPASFASYLEFFGEYNGLFLNQVWLPCTKGQKPHTSTQDGSVRVFHGQRQRSWEKLRVKSKSSSRASQQYTRCETSIWICKEYLRYHQAAARSISRFSGPIKCSTPSEMLISMENATGLRNYLDCQTLLQELTLVSRAHAR